MPRTRTKKVSQQPTKTTTKRRGRPSKRSTKDTEIEEQLTNSEENENNKTTTNNKDAEADKSIEVKDSDEDSDEDSNEDSDEDSESSSASGSANSSSSSSNEDKEKSSSNASSDDESRPSAPSTPINLSGRKNTNKEKQSDNNNKPPAVQQNNSPPAAQPTTSPPAATKSPRKSKDTPETETPGIEKNKDTTMKDKETPAAKAIKSSTNQPSKSPPVGQSSKTGKVKDTSKATQNNENDTEKNKESTIAANSQKKDDAAEKNDKEKNKKSQKKSKDTTKEPEKEITTGSRQTASRKNGSKDNLNASKPATKNKNNSSNKNKETKNDSDFEESPPKKSPKKSNSRNKQEIEEDSEEELPLRKQKSGGPSNPHHNYTKDDQIHAQVKRAIAMYSTLKVNDFIAVYGSTKDLWYGKVVKCPVYKKDIDEQKTFTIYWLAQSKTKKLEYTLLKKKTEEIEIGALLGVVEFKPVEGESDLYKICLDKQKTIETIQYYKNYTDVITVEYCSDEGEENNKKKKQIVEKFQLDDIDYVVVIGTATKLFKAYFLEIYQFSKGLFMTWLCLWDLYCKKMKKPERNPREILDDWTIIFTYDITKYLGDGYIGCFDNNTINAHMIHSVSTTTKNCQTLESFGILKRVQVSETGPKHYYLVFPMPHVVKHSTKREEIDDYISEEERQPRKKKR